MLTRLVHELLFDATSLVLSTRETGPDGVYSEPTDTLSLRRLLAQLAGHAAAVAVEYP